MRYLRRLARKSPIWKQMIWCLLNFQANPKPHANSRSNGKWTFKAATNRGLLPNFPFTDSPGNSGQKTYYLSEPRVAEQQIVPELQSQ